MEELLKVELFLKEVLKQCDFKYLLTCLCVCCFTLQAGADVNLPNNIGDTALHKAAFTGRKVPLCVLCFFLLFLLIIWFCACIYSSIQSIKQTINRSHIDQEVVMLLLHYDACATVINGTAQIPKDVTQNPEIRSMLEGERDTLSSSFHE